MWKKEVCLIICVVMVINARVMSACCRMFQCCLMLLKCQVMFSLLTPPSGDAQIHGDLYDYEQREIEKRLQEFRLTLHGCGRSSVCGITLATGFSIDLIDNVLKQATSLESVDDVLAKLPVFSYEHAKKIYYIVAQVMSN